MCITDLPFGTEEVCTALSHVSTCYKSVGPFVTESCEYSSIFDSMFQSQMISLVKEELLEADNDG